jgi:hypothetical protein
MGFSHGASSSSDAFWLRDGDVIEVPEKASAQ